MIVSTVGYVPGYEIEETLGVVMGNTVRAKNFGRDFAAGLKSLVGGEISGYTEMLTESRNIAYERMVKNAEDLGADAIIGMRFTTSSVMQGAAELLAFGTAVKLKKIDK
jgi:uncharacterized protein YbjQ (UPF0145 family)